jgi:hypothetical protein
VPWPASGATQSRGLRALRYVGPNLFGVFSVLLARLGGR